MRQRIINILLSHLLSSVNPDDIIHSDKGKLYVGDREVQDSEARSLIAEAKAIEGFRIWAIMQETIRNEAMDRGFNKSTTLDDLKTCKLMLYNLDILRSVVKAVRSMEK